MKTSTTPNNPEAAPAGEPKVRSSALLGRIAYQSYRLSVGGKAWNGDTMPVWDEMKNDPKKQKLVQAWEDAGRSVAHYVTMQITQEAVAAGYGGVMPNGNVVDRRIHPTAIPIPKNQLLNVPEPKAP